VENGVSVRLVGAVIDARDGWGRKSKHDNVVEVVQPGRRDSTR